MNGKRAIALLAAVMLVGCSACGSGGDGGSPDGSDINPPAERPPVAAYDYEGVPTAAPYTVCHVGGAATETFESMFAAIRYAGENASSSDPMPVKDANGLEIFRRQGTSKCWCYDGTNFVGTMEQKAALAWAEKHARSYVYNGKGTGFLYVGTTYPTEGRPLSYEQGSSGYSYLRTPAGKMSSNNTWQEYGYAYASGIVRLSEAVYRDADGSQWNAYVFFNIGTVTENCDLGIGLFGTAVGDPRYEGMEGQWKVIHNCTHASHKNGEDEHGSFHIWQEQTVTTMTKDPGTGVYGGADDLFIEAIGGRDTWTLRITNLATGERFGYTHSHEGVNAGKEGYYRINAVVTMIAAMGNPWDARCGGFLKNVVWEDLKVARYRADETYPDVAKEEFYPGLPTLDYGYTQGADCAHLTVGVHAEDGVYKSGAVYLKGSKYLAFSSYYDGTHIED